MATFTIYHTNSIDSAVLAGGSYVPGLPLEYLREQRPTLRARSVDTQLSSTQWTVALAEPLTSLGIQLISTNLSSAAQYKITWYEDATFTTPVDTTGFLPIGVSIDWTDTDQWLDWLDPNFWLGAQPFLDPDRQGRDVRHRFGSPMSLQYVKFEIDDQSNSDGFVQIGYLYMGKAYIPSNGVAYEPTYARISLTSVQAAVGGSEYFNRRGSRRRLSLALNANPQSEVLSDIDDIIQIHDIDKSVYVDLDPDDVTTGQKTAFLARLSSMPESRLVQVFFENDEGGATVGFDFTQVL